jgi:hypothetical protein
MYRDGVPEEDQRRLFQHARLSLAEQDAVKALARLGVRLNRVSARRVLLFSCRLLIYLLLIE